MTQSNPVITPQFLTTQDVATLLGVSISMVYLLVKRNEFGYTPIGDLKRFDRADIDAYLARQRAKVTTKGPNHVND